MAFSKHDDDLLLLYRFNEASGGPSQSDAVNTPTTYDDSNPFSADLTWTDSTANGLHELVAIDTGDPEHWDPLQWGGSATCVSGRISTTHHVLLSDLLHGCDVGGALSGSFALGFWANMQQNDSNEVLFYMGDGGVAASNISLRFQPRSAPSYNQPLLTVGDGSSLVGCSSSLTASGSVQAPGWNHYVINVNENGWSGRAGDYYVKFYVNGVLDTSLGNDTSTHWTDIHPIWYLSIFNYSTSIAVGQIKAAIKDFFLFNRYLENDEVVDIFNNGFSAKPILKSTTNNLILWYRFVEPSGTPINSWASNTPTARYTAGAAALDTRLTWYNSPDHVTKGIYSIDTGDAGHWYPYHWGESRICASGNTTDMYHSLRSENIDDCTIGGALASGSFSVGMWFLSNSNSTTLDAVFSFDRDTIDDPDLCLAFQADPSIRYNFIYNDGTGGKRYFYDMSDSGSGLYWNHVVLTHTQGGDGDGKYARFYMNGQLAYTSTDPEFDSLLHPYYLTFFNAHADYSIEQWAGAIDDFVLFDKALSAEEVFTLFHDGIELVTIADSSPIGGYIEGTEGTEASGLVGGWSLCSGITSGTVGAYSFGAKFGSGLMGGWSLCSGITSGTIGSYTFGAGFASGVAGGWTLCSGIMSGTIGGYSYSVVRNSGTIGNYTYSVVRQSGTIGGFVNGGLESSGVCDGGFRIKAITYADFDAELMVENTTNADFDAEIKVYHPEKPPWAYIKYPDGIGLAAGHDVSGALAPLVLWFVSSGVAVDGKTIDKATYGFGDTSDHVNATASGNDQYVATHRYGTSGIYVASFWAIDNYGMTGSDTIKIHLASGVPMPDVSLTASPVIGYAPLTVDFDYSITNVPNGVSITSKILYFGNGKSTISPDVSYVYTEPGIFTPILCVVDSRGFVTCDSLLVGVNN